MNGRIYDPTLGRMLQADPFIQAPLNSQNYNRYSYVINNPMSYTDPSGFNFFEDLVKGAGFLVGSAAGPAGGYAQAAIDHNVHKWISNSQGLTTTGALVVGIVTAKFCGECSIGFSALYTSNMASYNGASTSEAFHAGGRTAAVAGIFYGIGQTFNASTGFYETGGVEHIATHAVAGGVISVAQGGKFGHGFFSAGFTKYAGGYLPQGGGLGGIAVGTIASAVIGGTASAISGGKFANGAYTGAFQYLFNAALSADKDPVKLKISAGIDDLIELAYAEDSGLAAKIIGAKGGFKLSLDSTGKAVFSASGFDPLSVTASNNLMTNFSTDLSLFTGLKVSARSTSNGTITFGAKYSVFGKASIGFEAKVSPNLLLRGTLIYNRFTDYATMGASSRRMCAAELAKGC